MKVLGWLLSSVEIWTAFGQKCLNIIRTESHILYIFYTNSFSCRYMALVTRYNERNKCIANPTYSGTGKDDEGSSLTELDCRNICELILNNLPPSWSHCWQIGITKVWQSLDFSSDSGQNFATVRTYMMALDFYWIDCLISWESIPGCRSNVSKALKYVFVLYFKKAVIVDRALIAHSIEQPCHEWAVNLSLKSVQILRLMNILYIIF